MEKLSNKKLADARVKAGIKCSMVAGHVCNPMLEDPLCLACLEGDREQILKMKEGGENV